MSAFDAEYEPSPWKTVRDEVPLRAHQRCRAEPARRKHWVILWTLGAKSRKV